MDPVSTHPSSFGAKLGETCFDQRSDSRHDGCSSMFDVVPFLRHPTIATSSMNYRLLKLTGAIKSSNRSFVELVVSTDEGLQIVEEQSPLSFGVKDPRLQYQVCRTGRQTCQSKLPNRKRATTPHEPCLLLETKSSVVRGLAIVLMRARKGSCRSALLRGFLFIAAFATLI